MRKMLLMSMISLSLFACKKEPQPVTETFSEAAYKVTVAARWNATDFGVPAGAHFTLLAGAVHNKTAALWTEGMLASRSLEYIAENGFSAPLLKDVDTLIQLKKALAPVAATAPLPTGTTAFNLTANTDFPLLSFASMLAPSPDWFIGINSLALYRNHVWLKDTTVQLYAYDAGTEEGDVFSYYNADTSPQQPVKHLDLSSASALFKGTVLPVAEMRIQKME